MKKIVVTGGTGVLGSALISKLKQQPGIQVVVISRNRHKQNTYSPVVSHPDISWRQVDLISGEGLAETLNNTDTVIHLATDTATFKGTPVDILSMNNLLLTAQRARVKHLIYSSIVGIDRIPYSYYKAKLTAEKMLHQSAVPYTILRATQFHNFIDFILSKLFTLPVGFVPKNWKAQPVSIESVAAELLSYASKGPQQTVFCIGGHEVLNGREMAAIWQKYQPRNKPVLGLPLIGNVMQAFTKGYNTCAEVAPGSQTWEDYLRTALLQPLIN